MDTKTEMSHDHSVYPQIRAQYLKQAQEYGLQALANAERSKDVGKLAQVKLKLACVKAREVQLEHRMDPDDQTVCGKRDNVLEEIGAAIKELRTMNLDNIEEFEQWAKIWHTRLKNLPRGSSNQ